jgi:hypothetical protein
MHFKVWCPFLCNFHLVFKYSEYSAAHVVVNHVSERKLQSLLAIIITTTRLTKGLESDEELTIGTEDFRESK